MIEGPPRAARRDVLRRLAGVAVAIGCATPAFGAAGRVLRIGSTIDHSGPERAIGTALLLGASACFDAINRAGGIGGARLQLVLADDQSKPELAQANAIAFDGDRSFVALLQPMGMRPSAAVIDAVPNMPVIGPATGSVELRRKGASNVFWLRAGFDQEVDKLVATAATLGARSVGLVHAEDGFGRSVATAFGAAIARHQLTPGVIATTPDSASPEVAPAAQAIAKAAPQIVIMGLASSAPEFVRALRAAGGVSAIYGLSIAATAANLRELGEAARGLGFSTVVPSPSASRYELVRRYQADLQADGSRDLSLASLEGYINARVLAEGLRRAGIVPTRAQLIAALESIEAFDLGGLRIGFGKGRREGSSFVDVAVVGPTGRMNF